MTARTQRETLPYKEGKILAFKQKANTVILSGASIFVNAAGYAFNNDGTTNLVALWSRFVGFAFEDSDSTGLLDGEVRIRVYAMGVLDLHFPGTLSQANVWDLVYINNVTDDSQATVTSDTGNPQATIWYIYDLVSTSIASVVLFPSSLAVAGA